MSALQFTLLGYAVRLAQPEYLFGLLAAALAVIAALASARARRRELERAFAEPTRGRAAPQASALRHGLKGSMGALALALFSVALAQPQCGTHTELAKQFGIDVVVALDASASMMAKDIKPSRIERAKLELSSLLDRLKGDRVGIVVFAGDAFTQCPLTSDYAAAKMFLRAVDPAAMPVQGTNLDRALEESKTLLVDAELGAKARAIVLLTDGEDTSSENLDRRLGELKDLGIRVLAVGIGSATGEPIPEVDKRGNFVGYKKDRSGATVMSRLDEAGLASIAERTGGRYIHSTAGDVGVQEVHQELDRLDKAELESRLTVKYEERYPFFAFPGLLLILGAAALRPARAAPGEAAP